MSQTRTAIVTGAAQGIGLAIARRFCEEGYHTVLLDVNEEKVSQSAAQLSGCPGKAIGMACDVSKPEQIAKVVEQVAEQLGGIDIVVNNAGILRSTPIPDVTEEEWDLVLAVNLKSVFFMTQKALPYLKKSAAPRIINISSLAGRMGGYETGLSYSASKGGILALTMGLSRQLARFGITVNAVCPSTTESDIILQWTQQQIDGLRSRVPLGRLGKPEEIASAAYYLSTEEAGYITGLMMDVNGGIYMG